MFGFGEGRMRVAKWQPPSPALGASAGLPGSVYNQEVCAMSSNDHHSPAISVEDADGVRVVTLRGEHDLSTVSQIATACAAAPATPLVVDLTEATFIDSSVISELVRASNARSDRDFAVAIHPQSDPARVLSLTVLDTIMPIVNDLTEAIRIVSAYTGTRLEPSA
jgi:anti-anti-sigma factor